MQKKLEKQRAFFRSGRTIPLAFRKKGIETLRKSHSPTRKGNLRSTARGFE